MSTNFPLAVKQKFFSPDNFSSNHAIQKATVTKETIAGWLRVIDALTALGAVCIAFVFHYRHRMPNGLEDFLAIRVTVRNLILLASVAVTWFVVCRMIGLYRSRRNRTIRGEAMRIMLAGGVGGASVMLMLLVSMENFFGLQSVVFFTVLTITGMGASRALMGVLTVYSSANARHPRQVVIVGTGRRALAVYQQLQNAVAPKYSLVGFVDSTDAGHQIPDEIRHRHLSTLKDFENLLVSQVVDEVIITLPLKSRYSDIENIIDICERVGVEAKFPLDVFRASRVRTHYEHTPQLPCVAYKSAQDDYRIVVKRLIDIVGALVGIIILSPLMIAVAVIIVLTDGGGVFFVQERYGYNKRRFRMYKFRTMVVNAEALMKDLENRNEASGPIFKIKNDPRVTRIGSWLRRTSIDELPQLFNVLRGEMSLVGPRPMSVRDVTRFDESHFMRRFCVRPGLTCLWQIGGRSNTDFNRWLQLDIEYIERWSLMLDLKILIKTLPAVCKGSGAC